MLGLITNPQSGGLEGLLDLFKNKGLGDLVSSWVSRGQNLPISAQEIQQALGKGQVKQIAKNTGMSRGAAAEALSQLLPQLIEPQAASGDAPFSPNLAWAEHWCRIQTSKEEDRVLLAKNNRAFKSAKRNKELARIQKREEKRLRRQSKQEAPGEADVQVESPLEERTPESEPGPSENIE